MATGAAARAAGGAAVGPFRDAAARHGADLLPDHDVYITDWHNARDMPLSAGRFGFDEYVDHVIEFLETIGPGAHMLGGLPALRPGARRRWRSWRRTATRRSRASMTLMAGPIDTRINPTKVNELANEQADRLVRARS